jgi:hypothetical protein
LTPGETYVQRIQGGRANLSVKSLLTVALHLRVEVSDLFTVPVTGPKAPGRPGPSPVNPPHRKALYSCTAPG